jgi:hypothetical protein
MLCYGHKITSSNPVCVEITDEQTYPIILITNNNYIIVDAQTTFVFFLFFIIANTTNQVFLKNSHNRGGSLNIKRKRKKKIKICLHII